MMTITRRDVLKLVVTGAAVASVTQTACSTKSPTSSTASTVTSTGTPDALRTQLEDGGFYVQDGTLYELDTIELASQGKLLSCFGNNAGSSYMVLNLPAAPNQEAATGDASRGWQDDTPSSYMDGSESFPANPYFAPGGWQYKLRQDEAIVIVCTLPPECKYWSYISYVMFTSQKEGKDYTGERSYFSVGNDEVGLYHPVFGSIGASVNMDNVKHEGESAYGTQAVLVLCANASVRDTVKAALEKAGYPEGMVNVMEIPARTYDMGLERGRDTFCFLGRVSQPSDQAAYETYMEGLASSSTVFRVTPHDEVGEDPFANATLAPRGTGAHEVAQLDGCAETLDAIRSAVIARYSDGFTYEELSCDIAVPEGLTAYLCDRNALGDNRDTSYIMTGDFTLDSDDDFIVVYGVNHTSTGKARYSNAVLYVRPMLNGVCSVYDSLFSGSAEEWLDDATSASSYYVYKMARTQLDEHTALIPYSTNNEQGAYYGTDNGSTLVLAFRAYVDETGVGPSYYEIVYDRAIVFHKG